MTAEELRGWVDSPSRWPLRPALPMKLYLDEGIANGLILEGRGLAILDYESGQPVARFSSVDEMAEAGWEVD